MQTLAPSSASYELVPDQVGVEPVDRRGFGEVERLALRNALGNVEQHDIAKLLEADQMSEGAADLACTDQCNLGTRHVGDNPEA